MAIRVLESLLQIGIVRIMHIKIHAPYSSGTATNLSTIKNQLKSSRVGANLKHNEILLSSKSRISMNIAQFSTVWMDVKQYISSLVVVFNSGGFLSTLL